MHSVTIDPAILYFGTPVALLSTENDDGSTNLAPMSSIFWLGHTAVLGLGSSSRTAANLLRTGECVINLPSADQVDVVDRLALTTGRPDVPEHKRVAGYEHEPDKFGRARLSPAPSATVAPLGAAECPVRLETRLVDSYPLGGSDPEARGRTVALEVAVQRVRVHDTIRVPGTDHRIDPDRWRPLIMSFQRYYGLGTELHPSRLATIDESWYR